MTEKKFIPMYDLDALTEAQRQQYYLDACAHLHVPPELNVLAYQLMDTGDGARKLVLYIKKGATDIIRETQGIDTKSLVQSQIGGSVIFTATGVNKNGRQEIAVGSKAIEGLRGQALDSAIMTAQTRATRRMTLQFAGGGFLDENEIREDSSTTDVTTAPSLAKIASQPSVAPSSAPGKDITETKPATPISAPVVPVEPLETPEQMQARIFPTDPTPNPPAEKPKRRSSRKKEVSFDKPFSLEPSAPVSPSADIPESQPATTHECPSGDHEICTEKALKADWTKGWKQSDLVSPAPVPAPVLEKLDAPAPVPVAKVEEHIIPNLPDQTQIKGFRDELFRYTNDILPKAGMVPSEIGGGVGMKVRAFASAKYKAPFNQLTTDQWKDFFSCLEGTIKTAGPEMLVKLIDDVAEGRVKI